MTELCQGCELQPGKEEHVCPHKYEYGDGETCNCCVECRRQCAMDI